MKVPNLNHQQKHAYKMYRYIIEKNCRLMSSLMKLLVSFVLQIVL